MAAKKPTAQLPFLQPSPRRAGVAAAYVLWWLSDGIDFSGECWTWKGHASDRGYGIIDLKHYEFPESTVLVHRLVYSICVEPIPDGLCVLHRCDNPPCCRPEHLFLGTNLDNIADKMAKGRHRSPKGENHGSHKLTAELVMTIRRRAAAGESYASIARDLGFSATQVSAVARGLQWRHIPMLDLVLGKE